MNEPEPLSSGNSNTARNRRVERVCDEFEAHLKAGSSPQLEDYLATAPPPDRRDLLGHLLALEVSYLADRGERPLAGAYHARFAEHSDTISKVFDSFEALASSRQPTDDLARVPHHAPQAGPSVVGSTSYSCAIGPGGVIAGRFQLVNRIGEGGMGEVWVAKQSEPVKRKVAVKLIKAGMDSKAVLARFEHERQALAMMDHPNIAKVLDGGMTPDGRPFFVMELVNGLPLTKFCDEAKLTPRARLELFVLVCQAVQHAHQKGIVHRDLKPSNVLITVHDGKPVPKVIDFGVAKATGGKLTDETLSTQFGAVVGTLEYMSPEQAGYSGADVDTRADIYSLGVILYELLTGLRPVDGRRLRRAALTEMVRIIREEEPLRPSNRLSSDEALPSLAALRQTEPKRLMAMLRGELDWVVMKCLEKQRERRYETASGLYRDIQRYLADEAVEARPPSAGYRLNKFLKRNKGSVIAAGVVLVVLLAGMVGTTLGLVRAMKAEGVATQRFEEAEAARAKAAASAVAAEKAEAATLDDYRASTDDAVEQLIGSKLEFGVKERAYLESTLTRWQTFADRKGDDEHSRVIRGEGHYRVAFLLAKLDRKEEARREFQVARDLREKLVEQFPAMPRYQQELANTQNNLGLLLRDLGKREDARVELQAARNLQQKLVEQFPAVSAYQQDLASTHNRLGLLLRDLGKQEDAQTEYLVARDLRKRLVEQFPAMPRYQQELASTRLNLGNLLAGLGKPEDASAEYLAGRELQNKLVERSPAVPEYQYELAGTHSSLGILLAGLGKLEEARAEFQAARDLQQKLVEQFPTVPRYQMGAAKTRHNLGNLLIGLRKLEDARAEFQAAGDLRKKLVEQFPAIPEYQQDLAKGCNSLGNLLEDLGKPEDARVELQSARDHQKKLVEQFPSVPEYQHDLAMTNSNLVVLLTRLGRGVDARAEFQSARDLLKKLVEQYPAVSAYQVSFGVSYFNFGVLIRDEGKPAESLEWFDLAIRTLQLVHEKEPRYGWAKQSLAGSYSARAKAYDRLQKPAESVKDWDRAIELSPPAERPECRARRAASQIRAGLVAEAVAEVAELTAPVADAGGSPKWNAGESYNFACVYAIASGKIADKKQEYGDRAMELLTKAIVEGINVAADMVKDPDLDPLRERTDFKKLLAQIQATEPKEPETN